MDTYCSLKTIWLEYLKVKVVESLLSVNIRDQQTFQPQPVHLDEPQLLSTVLVRVLQAISLMIRLKYHYLYTDLALVQSSLLAMKSIEPPRHLSYSSCNKLCKTFLVTNM